jgi:hypothetical protein
MEPKIEFDKDGHVYTVDGETFPSVTKILGDVGIIDTRFYKHSHTLRGNIVHECTALIDNGIADADSFLDGGFAGYITAYERFKRECNFKPESIEKYVACMEHRYAGTIDRVGALGTRPVILDLKTGRKEKSHQLQLAAYRYAYKSDIHSIMGLYLSEDGKYKLIEYDYTKGINLFLNALSIYKWKMEGKNEKNTAD